MEKIFTWWQELKAYLPDDWQEKCKELKCIQRKREIKTPEQLLTLNMLYATSGASFAMTSELFELETGIRLNKSATAKRISKSGEWLRILAKGVSDKQNALRVKPAFLGEKRAVLIDASDMTLMGSKRSDYRMHYAFDLFGFKTQSVEISGIDKGERLSNFKLTQGDIAIGDRAYGTKQGIVYAEQCHADYILRIKHNAFKLYDEEGQLIDVLAQLQGRKAGETATLNGYIMNGRNRVSVRLVSMQKNEEAIAATQKRLDRRVVKKQQAVSPNARIFNESIVVVTSLKEMTAEQILELYRARWQIEKVFQRMKSIIAIDEITVRNEDAVKAWFYGKLLLAALCEAMTRASFPPKT